MSAYSDGGGRGTDVNIQLLVEALMCLLTLLTTNLVSSLPPRGGEVGRGGLSMIVAASYKTA
jgi:hypothetical protein